MNFAGQKKKPVPSYLANQYYQQNLALSKNQATYPSSQKQSSQSHQGYSKNKTFTHNEHLLQEARKNTKDPVKERIGKQSLAAKEILLPKQNQRQQVGNQPLSQKQIQRQERNQLAVQKEQKRELGIWGYEKTETEQTRKLKKSIANQVPQDIINAAKIDELQNKLRECQAHTKHLIKQKNNLKAQYERAQSQNKQLKFKAIGKSNLEQQIRQLKVENKKLSTLTQSQKDTLSKFKPNDLKYLQHRNKMIEVDLSQCRNQLQQRNKEVQKLNKVTTQLINQKTKLSAKNYMIEIENNKKLEQLTRLKEENSQLIAQRPQSNAAKQRNSQLLQQNQQLKRQINQAHKVQPKQAGIKNIKTQYQRKVTEKQKQITEQLLKQIQKLKATIKQKDQQSWRKKLQFQKGKEQKLKQIHSLNSQMLNKEKIIKDLQNNQTKMISNYEDLKIKCQNLQKEKKNLTAQNNEHFKEFNKMAAELQSNTKRDTDTLQNQIKNRDIIIQRLKQQSQKAKTQATSFSYQKKYQALQQQQKKLQKKLQQKQSYLKEIQSQNNQLNQKYAEMNKEVNKLQNEKDQLRKELDELYEKYDAQLIRKVSRDDSQKVKKLSIDNQQLIQRCKQLENSRALLQNKYNQLASQYKSLANQKKKDSTSANPKDTHQINKLKQEKVDLEKKLAQANQNLLKLSKISEELTQAKLKYGQIQVKFIQGTSQIELRNREINRLKQNNQKLSTELAKLKSKQTLMETKVRASQQINKQIQTKNQQLSKSQQKAYQLSHELSQLKAVYLQLQKKNEQLSKQISRAQTLPSFNISNDFNHLFHGEVLREHSQYKLFIKECIQKHQKIRIVDTRLLYRYDPLNKQNIHKYIDQKPQIVVVVKLINGYCVAGYAQGFFKPKTPSDKQGLLMSLTNSKCYYLIQRNKRSIAYDDFFVIFGNSQIRIKSQQKKMFSNFGLSNSYYRHHGDGVGVLMGGTKTDREMEVISYQFFQLILQE